MSLTVKPVVSEKLWEKCVANYPEANFLASWNWGEFHQKLGKNIYRLGFSTNHKLVGCAQIIEEPAKRGKYLTIAGGPLINWQNHSHLAKLVKEIKHLGQQKKAIFIRIRPQILNTQKNRQLFLSHGFQQSPMHLTADLTLQLDLSQSLDQILSNMRKSTRYEIKKAEKLGIKVTTSKKPTDINEFFKNQLYLSKKHNFVPFSKKFLQTQFKIFATKNQALLFNSYYQNKLLAQAFIILYGSEAVYHYGTSTPNNQKLPGSYACQWAAIKEAKSRGLNRYNFWGIAPSDAPKNHRFSGVSLFKRGFGGQEIAYLPAHDLPINNAYYVVNLFEKIRSKIRRLN